MSFSGRLAISLNSPRSTLTRFLAKCAGIPILELPKIDLMILAALPQEFKLLRSKDWFPNQVFDAEIEKHLELKSRTHFLKNDIKLIAKKIADYRKQNLLKTQRAYLALSDIGRPAHFSEIAKKHNMAWPNFAMSEHNIHAALSHQKHGIVWIGLKGIYALKEWGYDRPSLTLFETVTKIVQNKYKETNRVGGGG